jgi:Zn-dependent protease/CBS domain-containing protein
MDFRVLGSTIRLGRIAGIPIGLNWSLLLVFWLVTWSLAANQFPSDVPGASTGAYWLAGAAAAVFFFASLLAHEMAHALVARRLDVQVHEITLWLFGGVARLGGEAHSAAAEAKIAIVGPLTSVGLAAVFWILAIATSSTSLLGDAFLWLARINLILALFNMIPAFPLDGGRVLRAALWSRQGDRIRATVTAARVGRAFGFILIALGLIEALVGGMLGGLWTVFIGWFLLSAAGAEEASVMVRQALSGIHVRDVMSPNPVTVPNDITVQEFVDRWLFAHRHSTFPVVDASGQPTGLLTLDQVRGVPAETRGITRVRQVACPLAEVTQVHPLDWLADVVTRMGGCSQGRALVIDGQQLVGVVSPSDVNRVIRAGGMRRVTV